MDIYSKSTEQTITNALDKRYRLENKLYKIIHNDSLYNSNKPDIKEIKRILMRYGYSDLSSYIYDHYNF